MSRKGLTLKWARQSKAKAYEIVWNTKTQECDEFVNLTKTTSPRHLIPKQFVSGKMQFRIRAINKCDVASAYSRTLILTVSSSSGGGSEPERNCDKKGKTVTKRGRPENDYDSRTANAVAYFWSDLLSKRTNGAAAAVKWAFPDRGREADMMRAQTEVEEAITEAIKKQAGLK